MANSQPGSNSFKVRIVSIDHCMAPPVPGLDICYSSFQGEKVNEVPVIRIYGPTPAGQKTCLHVHGVLPYLYVPYADLCPQGSMTRGEGDRHAHELAIALEKALKLKGIVRSKRQHVHDCKVVRAKRLYGYHKSEELFVKIYLYYPHDVSRASTLLLNGGVLDKSLQPHESHIPFLLQFMIDYNLYGMGHIHLARLKFRHPLPEASSPRKHAYSQSKEEMNECSPGVSHFQADSGEAAYSSPVWTSSSVPVDWTWHASNELGESSNEDICSLKRLSICELEGDATVDDILNQQLKTYTSFSQSCLDVKLVQSLVAIWQEEYETAGILEDNFLHNPGKPPPEDVLKTFSNGVGFESKLMELFIDVDESSCQCDTVVGPSFLPLVVNQNLPEIASGSPNNVSPEQMTELQEKDALEFWTLNRSLRKQVVATSSEGRNASLNLLSSGNIVASDVKATDSEAQELLRWLATSQAAEDINSDDELICETILTPGLPATSIDKVLEKASMDFESESQKECQDILDSVEDSPELRCPEERAPCVSKDSNFLVSKMILQSDGSSDDTFPSFNAESGTDSFQEDVKQAKSEQSLQHPKPQNCNTCYSKIKPSKHLWGTLPISGAKKVTSKSDSGECNRSYACPDDFKESAGTISFVQNRSEKLPDDFFSNEMSSLIGCSVRDLMRRKRSRTEPAGCGPSKTERLKSNKERDEYVALSRKKLEFCESYGEKCERTPPEYICEVLAPNSSHSKAMLDSVSTSNNNINFLGNCVHAAMAQVLEKPQLISETKIQGIAACMAKPELNDGGKSESRPGLMGTMYSRIDISMSDMLCDVEIPGVRKSSPTFDHLQQECENCSGSISAFPVIHEMLGVEGDVKTCEKECKMCRSSGKSPQAMDETSLEDNKNCVGEEQAKDSTSLNVGCSMSVVVDREAKPGKVIDSTFCREASEPPESATHYFSVNDDSQGKPGRLSFGSLPHNDGSSQRETKSGNKYLENSVHFSYEKEPAAVQRLYRHDGSCLYLLTPVISPPSVDSVKKWLVSDMEGTARGISAVLTEHQSLKVASGCVISSESPSSNASSEAMVEAETGSLMRYAFEQAAHEKDLDLDSKNHLYVDKFISTPQNGGRIGETKLQEHSQYRSQISGPDVKSKSTPLSQIGFRDSASIGAGQQLTLLSVEVQAECRGDLRPDPRFDAVNIVSLAFQNDNDSAIEVHVLLYSKTESSKRNPDGISGCKVFVFSEEKDLLDFFTKFLRSLDPDIVMGWDVQGGSLGYLAERSAHLGIRLLHNISRILPEATRVLESKIHENEQNHDLLVDSLVAESDALGDAVIQDEWGRTHASGVHVGGRIVLNIWRLMRSEVNLNLYTIEAVAESVLMRKIPSIHHKVLRLWFSTGPSIARYRCIEYMVERAKLNLEIMNQLDMINRTSELARVFGIDFFSVLSRGSQYRVESMLLRLAHTQNYLAISPGSEQVASQPAMECIPLVMEPESGFFADPVIVLDFQSLYPSMVIAYNLCFSTCLGKVAAKPNILGVSSYSLDVNALRDLKDQILLTPNSAMYVSKKVRRGVLPRLLEEILSTRIMVKHAMKKLSPSQRVRHRILNARQLALKLIANVTYGYTAAGFSGRMPCAELADSIVQCGRSTLERAIAHVNANEKWRAKVVYGDTDSMFVQLKGRSLKEAFDIGNDIASAITAMNPNPVALKMEKVYQPCFLLTKKRYVGYSYESPDQVKPLFDAKGVETVRRDTCKAVAKTMEQSLRLFFEHQDISEVKSYLHRQWSRIMSGRVSLQDFVFAKEVRLGTYSTSSSILPPAAIVATKAMRADPRAEPRYAERVPYVVIHGDPGARLIDMVVDPLQLLAVDSSYRLNDLYYINKQIIPALQRIFGLVGADLKLWFMEMPRPMRRAYDKYGFNGPSPHKKRIDYYYLSRNCLLCGELVLSSASLCTKCSQNEVAATAAISGRTAKLERDVQHLAAICRHCGGGDWLMESGVKCTSLACSVFYERRKVQKELWGLSAVAYDKGLYPKCIVEWF